MDDGAPPLWTLADLEPNKSPSTLAEELALHFTEITNQADPLQHSQIPVSSVPNVLVPQLLELSLIHI